MALIFPFFAANSRTVRKEGVNAGKRLFSSRLKKKGKVGFQYPNEKDGRGAPSVNIVMELTTFSPRFSGDLRDAPESPAREYHPIYAYLCILISLEQRGDSNAALNKKALDLTANDIAVVVDWAVNVNAGHRKDLLQQGFSLCLFQLF